MLAANRSVPGRMSKRRSRRSFPLNLTRQEAKAQNLQLDDAANQLLCYCYEAICWRWRRLERLSLLWPDGEVNASSRVEQARSMTPPTLPLFTGGCVQEKQTRALHILQQLRLEAASRSFCCGPSGEVAAAW
ncbi:hypothetical protein KCP77_18945 [Salmonella enterica subsp. enterica]|nr:hypothetical protein KCP77_18945 [Salmonella enterica subsp. enterica]